MNRPERFAALLLAHETDAQAIAHRARFMLRSVDAVLIHYDARAPHDVFASLRNSLADEPAITLIPTRIRVNWGGDDMVVAMLALLDSARAIDGGFDHYLFVSTSHYPLWDRERTAQILAELAGASGRESKPMPLKEVMKRLIVPFDKGGRRSTFSPSGLLRNVSSLASFATRHGWPRWGSQWVVVASADLALIDTERRAVEQGAYGNWKILDEVFFQTVLHRSGRDFLSTYFTFTEANTGSPQSLTLAQVHELKHGDGRYIFARKVAPGSEIGVDMESTGA